MKIITAGDAGFRHMIDGQIRMNAQCGHETLVYNIGGLGYGKPFDISADLAMIHDNPAQLYTGTAKQKGSFKPAIILDALMAYPGEQQFAWIDGDAFTIKPLDDVFKNEFDVAVTMRRPDENPHSIWPMFDQYINSGVMFFRNNERARRFVREMIRLVPLSRAQSDQEAVNMLLIERVNFKNHGHSFDVDGMKVLILTTDEYNWYYFPEPPNDNTRVLHFKGQINHDANYFDQYFRLYYKP